MSSLTSARDCAIIYKLDRRKYPRGRRGSPAKGVAGLKPGEGSNPSFRATTSSRTSYRSRRRFFVPNKRHRSFTPSLLLSKLNPLRWASIWGFSFSRTSYRSRRRFFFQNNRHRSFISSLLLSKLEPLCRASIWGFFRARCG